MIWVPPAGLRPNPYGERVRNLFLLYVDQPPCDQQNLLSKGQKVKYREILWLLEVMGKLALKQRLVHIVYILSFLLMMACSKKETDTAEVLLVEPSSEPEEQEVPQPSSEPESHCHPVAEPTEEAEADIANGEEVVNSRCMGCHIDNPSIERAGSMTDEELLELFALGQGEMPPQNLFEQEAYDVIAYLRVVYGGQ